MLPAHAPRRTPCSRARRWDSFIAQPSRRAGVTVDQMIVAIFRANPDAFIRNNLNRVRAGSVLTIPSAEEAMTITLDEARRVIAENGPQPDA